jgi:hypothetical protein
MAYSTQVIDHYENPRNVGSFDKGDESVGTGMVGAPACGDVMKLQIKVEDGVITDARFKTYGCGSAIASSSLITEMREPSLSISFCLIVFPASSLSARRIILLKYFFNKSICIFDTMDPRVATAGSPT